MHLKAQAEAIFRDALRAVDVREAVRRKLAGLAFAGSRVLIVAIGKASAAMYEAAQATLRERWHVDGLVVGPVPPADGFAHFFIGAHPIPDESSAVAAKAILAALQSAGADTMVLFLLSGGASAMAEAPVDRNVTIRDIAAFHRVLVGSGLPIAAMNHLRKRISSIKGGGLAQAAHRAGAQLTLIVSDVPRGDMASVGSGPSLPDDSGQAWQAAWEDLQDKTYVPASIARIFDHGPMRGLPDATDGVFARSAWHQILSGDDLAEGARAAARAAGFRTVVDNGCDEWACEDALAYLLQKSRELESESGVPTCFIAVGEVVLRLAAATGRGGRNQHLCLQAAQLIAGEAGVAVLSAGSDGIDGNSPAAGAVVDGDTWNRAVTLGLEPWRGLEGFDSYRVMAGLGSAIVTGPTGNNVRDLRLVLRSSGS